MKSETMHPRDLDVPHLAPLLTEALHSIRLTFSIADLNNSMEEEDFSEDQALMDEADDGDMDAMNAQTGGANTKGSYKAAQKDEGMFSTMCLSC